MPGEASLLNTDEIVRPAELTSVRSKPLFGLRNVFSISQLRGRLVATTAFTPILSAPAFAQSNEPSNLLSILGSSFLKSFESTEILMLAIFGGAMSFALLSATWLIRERNAAINENVELKRGLADLRARNDRNEALAYIPGQLIVIWNGMDEHPSVLGELGANCDAPSDHAEFLKFSGWINNKSLREFEKLLKNLRNEGTGFEIAIKTQKNRTIEAIGRTSGGHAFVRFHQLDGQIAEHAQLKTDHQELVSTFSNLEALFQKLEMPVWMRRSDGKLMWTNDAYANAVEAKNPKDAVNRNLELFDHEQREEIAKAHDKDGVFSGIRPAVVAGDRRQLDIVSIKTENGLAGIACDQNELEEIRNALSETIDSHSKMLDQLATAVAIFDKSQKLSFYNSGFQQLWKLDTAFLDSNPSNSEILDAMRDQKMLPEHPDWRKWRDEQLAIYTAMEANEEWWHLLDGQTLRVVVSPQNQGGTTWIFENVTERLALESNYNSLMRVQGETLDHLNDAVAVFGSDGKLKLFNPTLETLWQFDDLVISEGLHIAQIIEAWTESISNQVDLENMLGKITGFDDERSNQTGRLKLSDEKTLNYSLVPLPEGQTMLTMADVTASVNFEQALRDRAEALEASDHLKNQFIQHVSYELRAPLTTISGFGEMLETNAIGKLNDKQAEYIAHINESANVLKAIVDDIMDLASIDAGQMTLDLTSIMLPATVNSILEEFNDQASERNIKLKSKLSEKLDQVLADAERFEQILHNLISNAISHSPDGGHVTVGTEIDGEDYIISVADEGPGVAEKSREAIFDRFESRSPDGKRKGTGLGLSIVRSFVQLHGGTVHVESAGKRGSRFVCKMPLNPQTDDAATPATAAA